MEVLGIILIIASAFSFLILCMHATKRRGFNHLNKIEVKHYTFGYIARYKWRILFGTQIKIVGTVMDLLIPYILAYIIDTLVPSKDIKMVIIYGALMLGCAIVGFLGNMFANQLASFVAMNVTKSLRHDLFNHILSLSQKELDELTISSLVSRMTSDTYNIHHMTGMIQRIGTRAPILLIGGLIVTFILDKNMTFILFGILLILTITILFISKLSFSKFQKVQENIDKVVKTLREDITGVKVIKALVKEEYEKNRFDKVNAELINYELKSGTIMAYLNPVTTTIFNFGLILVIMLGASLVNKGEILPGKVLAFTTYFTIILNAMLSITRVFMILTKAIASSHRIDYCFFLQNSLEKAMPLKESPYFIEFRNVSFAYGKFDVLKNISFTLDKEMTLGIIGPTGSGKTTLINLLIHLYDVKDGEIFVNYKNILSIDNQTFRNLFGIVFQNDTIIMGSVRDNVNFGRNYSDEEILKALRIAEFEEFIKEDKDGLDKQVSSKGSNLSGGQRQRLLIARAVLSNPEILILDDSSSALDYKTDARIRKNIKKYLPHTTLVIVAQRVSSVSSCDKIIVLDNGEISGVGKHETLLMGTSLYQEIYKIQMGER